MKNLNHIDSINFSRFVFQMNRGEFSKAAATAAYEALNKVETQSKQNISDLKHEIESREKLEMKTVELNIEEETIVNIREALLNTFSNEDFVQQVPIEFKDISSGDNLHLEMLSSDRFIGHIRVEGNTFSLELQSSEKEYVRLSFDGEKFRFSYSDDVLENFLQRFQENPQQYLEDKINSYSPLLEGFNKLPASAQYDIFEMVLRNIFSDK